MYYKYHSNDLNSLKIKILIKLTKTLRQSFTLQTIKIRLCENLFQINFYHKGTLTNCRYIIADSISKVTTENSDLSDDNENIEN